MAKYFIFPGVLPDHFTADTLDEAQDKARGLALSGHETATVFEPVWTAQRSDALTETYLGNAVDTAAEVSAQVSLENAHANLNAKAATLSLVGGPDTPATATEAADAADTIHNDIMPRPQADGFSTLTMPCGVTSGAGTCLQPAPVNAGV